MDPIITLAIPTFNRADILDKSLSILVNDSAFDNRVEVVVSDNCSTDNTYQVVEKYTSRFSNIKYSRNETNIGGELNFCRVIKMGNGKYIKLCNDTVAFNDGFLQFMIDKIIETQETNMNIFFYRDKKNKAVICSNVDEFTRAVSFSSTWIGNFGVWKKNIEELEPLEQYFSTQLLQVIWTYKLIENSHSTIIYFRDSVEVTAVDDKGGYNVFTVFIKNYLDIMRKYYALRLINLTTFEINKFRLFAHFISIRMCWLILKSKKITKFENNGAWKIIFREYGYYPYFYFGFLLLIPIIIKNTRKKLLTFALLEKEK